MNALTTRPVDFSGTFEPNPVIFAGQGRPMVFLHGLHGPQWFPALDALAENRQVILPSVVGCTNLDEMDRIDGIFDLMNYYDDLFTRLGLDEFDLIGASFGGMAAAEYAALHNRKVRRLVLVDAFGLWDDALPVTDYIYQEPQNLLSLMYADPSSDLVRGLNTPETPDQQVDFMLSRMSAMAAACKFLWPIPDRGLHSRLHRICAPTLVVWGRQDNLIPIAYADKFVGAIRDSRIHVSEVSAHSPLVDDGANVANAIAEFLDC